MSMHSRAVRAAGFAPICALLVLLGRPDPTSAQERECTGWAVSCASVQVDVDGDRLVFYVPNAVRPKSAPRQGSGIPRDRVRVYRNTDGMTCDPASGEGCLDVTADWLENPEDTNEAGAGSATAAGAADPGIRSCDGDGRHLDPARGLDPDEGRRCSQPVAGYFILALPASAFLFASDGGEPDTVLPVAGDPGPFVGDDGTGSDGANAGSDSSGGSDSGSGSDTGGGGASGSGTDSGGEAGGSGSGLGEGPGSGESGGSGGGFGDLPPGGGTGGSDGGDPGMGEVPEPISTTLFGIGLLGYAGARLRQRAGGPASDEDA